MEELIKQLNQTIEVQCYSKTTIKSYNFHIKKFLKYYYNDLVQENIERHLYYLRTKKNYSPESLNIAKYALIYFFNKILKKKITIELQTIKRKQSIPRPIDRDIIIKLIQNTPNIKHRTLIELMYSCGARPFEVVKLKWTDLDLIDKSIRINQGKGRKDRISILSEIVINHLLDLKKLKPEGNDFIFFSNARPTNHLSKKTVQKILENVSIKAGLEKKVIPYNLRHSFGTHLLEDGTNLRYIQELMGHSSLKTTERYTRVAKKKLLEIKSPLDRLDLTKNLGVKSNKQNKENAT